MSNIWRFLWIDDQEKRLKRFNRLFVAESKKIGQDLLIKPIDVKESGYLEKLSADKSNVDLILLDHKLTGVTSEKGRVKTDEGTMLIGHLRKLFKDTPILGITAAQTGDILYPQVVLYDDFFYDNELRKNISHILTYAKEYKAFNQQQEFGVYTLALLNCPEDERAKLLKMLPGPVVHARQDKPASRVLFWIRHVLLTRPGLLYDRKWIANFIGLTESSFDKVESRFEKALYAGIFADPKNPRYWKNEVLRILNTFRPPLPGYYSWEKGRGLSKFSSKDYSRCCYCKEEFPEVIGFSDTNLNPDTAVPVHLKCSSIKSDAEVLTFFEDVRLVNQK